MFERHDRYTVGNRHIVPNGDPSSCIDITHWVDANVVSDAEAVDVHQEHAWENRDIVSTFANDGPAEHISTGQAN